MSNCERMAARHHTRMKAAALLLDKRLRRDDDEYHDQLPIGWSRIISRELRMNVNRRQFHGVRGRRTKGPKSRAKRLR